MIHLGFLGDGQNYHVQRWLPALAQAGLKVSLFTFRPPKATPPGVTVYTLRPPIAPVRGRLSIVDFWVSGRQVRSLLTENNVDVLYASYATHYGLAGTLAGFHPIMLQTWTFDVSTYPVEGWKRFFFRPQVNYVLSRADLITTDGEALATYVADHYPNAGGDIVPVRWGIDTDELDAATGSSEFRAAHGIPADVPVVVSGRGIDAVYQPHVVLPALLRLLESNARCWCIVLTLGHERDSAVQQWLDRLAGHPRCIVFDRFLERSEMAGLWTDGADVIVSAPSTDGISEGVLEAMYAGAIPVVSDIPSNQSFLKEGVNGYFVSGKSEIELADKLLTIVDQLGSIQERVVTTNREWVRSHASLKQTAQQVVRLVTNLARTHTRD